MTKKDLNFLNEILELKSQNKSKTKQITELQEKLIQCNKDWKRDVRELEYSLLSVEEEKDKLKHQLQAQPKQIVEEIMNFFKLLPTDEQVNEFLDNILTEVNHEK